MSSNAEVIAKARATGDVELKPCPYLTDAFESGPPYRVGILNLLLQGRLLLRDPVGCGKTVEALAAYAYYRLTNPTSTARLLVLTTDGAQFQWRSEVQRLTRFSAHVYGYHKRTQIDAERRQRRYLDEDVDVWSTTYMLAALDLPTLLRKPFLLVLDEVQLIRGGNQVRVKKVTRDDGTVQRVRKGALLFPAAQTLSRQAIACWGLSATPLMSKLENLHAIYDVIVPGLLGNEYQYKSRYLRYLDLRTKQGQRFPKLIGYKNVPELQARIAPYTLHRTEAEFGPYLPKVLPLRRIDVELGPKQRTLYDSCLKGWPDATGQPTNDQKLTAILHAQMLTSAPAVLGHPEVPSAKWEALKRYLIDEVPDQPVLVYTFFRSVAEWLHAQCRHEGIEAGLITGQLNAPQKHAVQEAFQTGKVRVVIFTSAAIYGVNLRAPVFVFYDLPWVWGDSVQAVGRARRRVMNGHPGSLVVAAVLATNTINEHTLTVLRRSQELDRQVNRPLATSESAKTLSNLSTPGSSTYPSDDSHEGRSRDPSLYREGDLLSEVTGESPDSLFGLSEADSIDALFAAVQAGEPPADVPLPVFADVS